MTVVVDTNVILVANGQHEDVSGSCVASCALRLQEIANGGRVAIDDEYRILKEYQHRTSPYAGKRPGDVFVKWLLRHTANPARCTQVKLEPHARRQFDAFPDDGRLANFDPADRKFVAVAMAHPERPPILQATDSKWLEWSTALSDHGVTVDFVCRSDARRFDRRRRARKRVSR